MISSKKTVDYFNSQEVEKTAKHTNSTITFRIAYQKIHTVNTKFLSWEEIQRGGRGGGDNLGKQVQ